MFVCSHHTFVLERESFEIVWIVKIHMHCRCGVEADPRLHVLLCHHDGLRKLNEL